RALARTIVSAWSRARCRDHSHGAVVPQPAPSVCEFLAQRILLQQFGRARPAACPTVLDPRAHARPVRLRDREDTRRLPPARLSRREPRVEPRIQDHRDIAARPIRCAKDFCPAPKQSIGHHWRLEAMAKFAFFGSYSPESWTRMIGTPKDRTDAVRQLIKGA